MELLHFDALLLVFEALRDEPASVETLVGCLPAEVKGGMPEAPSPQDRLFRVLNVLNGWQSAPDAEVPLRRFLRTAAALFVSQQKVQVFHRVLALLEEPPTLDLRPPEELEALELKITLTKYLYRQMGYEIDASGGQRTEVFFAWRGLRACVVGVCVGAVHRTIGLVRDGLRLAREATQAADGQVVLAAPAHGDEARDAIQEAGLRATSLDDLRRRVGRVTRERSLREVQSLVYRQIATFVEAEQARDRAMPAGQEAAWITEMKELLSAQSPSGSGRLLIAAQASTWTTLGRAKVAVAQAFASSFDEQSPRAPLHLEVGPSRSLELEECIERVFGEQRVRMSVTTALSLLDQDIFLPVICCSALVHRRSSLWGIVRQALGGATCGVLLLRSETPVTEAELAAWADVPAGSVRIFSIPRRFRPRRAIRRGRARGVCSRRFPALGMPPRSQ